MSKRKVMRRSLAMVMVLALLLSAVPSVGVVAQDTAGDDAVSTPVGGTLLADGGVQTPSENGLMAMSDTTVPYGPIALVDDGVFTFTLLSESEYSEMTLIFADALNKRTGATVTVGKSGSSTTYELIIGKYSSRSDSTTVYNAVAGYRNDNASDYVIRLVGTKLYVAATTHYAMQNALDYFLDTYVKDDQGRVSAVYENGDLVQHRPHHHFMDTKADGSREQFSLAGHKLSEYVIRTERYPSQLIQRSAVALQEFFMEHYGVVLPIKPVNTEATNIGIYGPEFRIGPMNGAVNMIRPNDTSFTKENWQEHITIESDGLIAGDYGYYEMTWDGDHIQLNGGSEYAISAATMRLIRVFEDQIRDKGNVMTPATTFTGNYQSAYDYLYGGGYDTVDFSLVDGFGLVYSDEFDYTGSDKKVYETVRSKWTLSQDMTYPTAGTKMSKETCTVFPDVYGENWWVAADTSGNNYLFEITKKHDKADETIGNTTYSFYEGVRLASQQKWGFKYGIWETRLVMGTHNGSSSAVWSHTREPYPQDSGYWHEIDVYENYGQDCFVPCLHSFDETMTSDYPHANDEDPENPLLMQGQFDKVIPSMDGTSTGGTNYQSPSWEVPATGEHFYDTFHHVSIDWSYDYLRVYLDGEMVSRIILGEDGPTGNGGIYENLFDCYRAGQTLKLSNGVGTNWYSRTRPVGEATASRPFTPDYWLGEAVNSFFEAQIIDYTRIYQTSNKDIHYEPAKNEMLFDDRFEFNETTKNRYGKFTKAQSFERYDPNEVLSLGSDAIVATEEEHLAGFSSAKVTTAGNGLYRAPQLVLKNVFDRPFTVEQGKDYDIVFYVKVPTTESDYDLKCWLTAAEDTVGLGEKTVTVTDKGGWQKVEIAIRDCPASGDLRLYITGSTDVPHTFYLEDIYVFEIVSRPVDETAMNFESAEVGTVLMSNNSGQNGSSVVISDKNSYSGSQSALFTTDTHSANLRAQMNVTDADGNPVKLEQGKDYWLNFKLYIDKAYYSAADVDANGNILTLKEEAFNFYAACVPDSALDTYFSGSFPYSYTVYEEEGTVPASNNGYTGTAKAEHQTRNEWIDVSVKIEDCAVSGNLRLGMSHYAQTQFYCYVDDVKVYEGTQNVTVKFDVNGGSGSYADQVVERGSTIAAVSEPTRAHYRFRGWHTDKDFTDGTYFVFGETPILGYNGDTVTLYARWEGAEHDYDNACDAICNWCGDGRAVGDHVYDYDCDADCNICGATRDAEHDYDNACDADCNWCGSVRAVGDHIYTNSCDTTCNVCGAYRSIKHTYASAADIDCDVCGLIRTTGSTSASVLDGKTAMFVGDSITYGGGEEKQGLPQRGWALRMDENYDMIVTNNGRSGYALSDSRADRYLHTAIIDGDYDYVVLQGGINDAMDAVAVGSIAETKELADFDTTTFAGGLERYFYYATTMYPDARIGFIITYDVPASVHGGNTREAVAYWEMARQICAKWNITYLDLHTEFFSDELLQTSTDRYLADGLYINSDGYDVITPYIAEWMATLKPYSKVGVHTDDGFVDMEGGASTSILHLYDDVCDVDCNLCGGVRMVSHTFSGVCDDACDLCGTKRVSQHTYDNACDADCNVCGDGRDAGHVYDNDCDADCNACSAVREVDHAYSGDCDDDCNLCGAVRDASAAHSFTNIRDTDCDICGDVRTLTAVAITKLPDTRWFALNTPLDTTGMELTLTYDDGDSGIITDGYEVSGYDSSVVGECAVTVIYGGQSCFFTVNVGHTPQIVVENVTAAAGATFSTDVRLQNNRGIVSIKVQIGYDMNALELVSAEGIDFAGVTFGPLTEDVFVINWIDSVHPNNTTDGVLARLTFKVKETAVSTAPTVTVRYDADDVFDYDDNNVYFETVDGTVTVLDYVVGDANGDGKLNNKDLSVLMRYLNGWDETVDERALDVNADGNINNKDYVILTRYLNGWEVVLK